MGGAAPVTNASNKAGKKPLDASLNLVPFIDLLACCIAFLLITAVWSQVARMDVAQKGQSSAGAQDEKPPENVVQLTLFIDKDGFTFAKSTGENTPIPKKGDEYDYTRLADILKDAKTAYPEKNDIMVKSDDDVIYNNIIRTMDVILSNKFPDVSLGDKGAAM
jgi:biopolymer transport protein ExbD